MSFELLQKIADAVLYEGYILYPYRASSVKNRHRWNFGVLYPQNHPNVKESAESYKMQTEFLVQGSKSSVIDIRLRFLHLQSREIGKITPKITENIGNTEPDLKLVDSLEVGNDVYQTWQEAIDRDITLNSLNVAGIVSEKLCWEFNFPSSRYLIPLMDEDSRMAGVTVKSQQLIKGVIETEAENIGDNLFKVRVSICNHSNFSNENISREKSLMHCFVSAHTMLRVTDGKFISLLDPEEKHKDAVSLCKNIGTWPVLVGEESDRSMMLSSPIILYDYPQISPESPGDLFDGTEIDEILTLRIMSLTDKEKKEMRNVDAHARRILERTESLPDDHFMKLHGTMRDTYPSDIVPLKKINEEISDYSWSNLDSNSRLDHINIGKILVKAGDRVRLRPKQVNTDIFDIALAGKAATIESIEQDFEDKVYIAVTVDDDPGKDFGDDKMPGHRFFFSPEEVEPLDHAVGEIK
ncbi:MAG: hypothetical protein ACRENO_10680 [Thermodesulfobacteriota bacterium]